MTVGEMIAAHHSRVDIRKMQSEWVAFTSTPLGAAFVRFEKAHHDAVAADCDENVSAKRLRSRWEAANYARRDLITLIGFSKDARP